MSDHPVTDEQLARLVLHVAYLRRQARGSLADALAAVLGAVEACRNGACRSAEEVVVADHIRALPGRLADELAAYRTALIGLHQFVEQELDQNPGPWGSYHLDPDAMEIVLRLEAEAKGTTR